MVNNVTHWAYGMLGGAQLGAAVTILAVAGCAGARDEAAPGLRATWDAGDRTPFHGSSDT